MQPEPDPIPNPQKSGPIHLFTIGLKSIFGGTMPLFLIRIFRGWGLMRLAYMHVFFFNPLKNNANQQISIKIFFCGTPQTKRIFTGVSGTVPRITMHPFTTAMLCFS
jgi:hypothetical protein